MPIVVDGKTFETDEEGYLANINDWVPGVAGVMAKEDDLGPVSYTHLRAHETVLSRMPSSA